MSELEKRITEKRDAWSAEVDRLRPIQAGIIRAGHWLMPGRAAETAAELRRLADELEAK